MSISLPRAFIDRVANEGFPDPRLLESLDTPTPTSIRLHPFKQQPEFKLGKKIEWCEKGYYLDQRPSFTLDPLFHAGCYYPQEAGSMLLDFVLRHLSLPIEPRVLDLCAAPGGKSTLLASFLNNKGCLMSNEIINQRSWILRENMSKAGYNNTYVSNNVPAAFRQIPDFFDLLVIDAPCSGEGMFRKDPNSRLEWSEQNVQLCSERQKDIIDNVWDSLRSGGYLIYSTCTFNADENENNVSWILNEYDSELIDIPFPVPIPKGREGIGSYGIPGITETEGFYIAVLRKTSSGAKSKKKIKKSPLQQVLKEKEVDKLIEVSNDAEIIKKDDDLYLIPKGMFELTQELYAHLNLYKIGTHIGSLSKKGLIPHEDLALNFSLVHNVPIVELDKQKALKYLHGDTFQIITDQGYNLMRYRGENLGWIKQIGNRFNNNYPKQWRIRMNVE